MNAQSRAQRRWGKKKFQKLNSRAKKYLVPYQDKMETPEGMMAGVILAGLAHLVVNGLETRQSFDKSVRDLGQALEIPHSAMSAQAEILLFLAALGHDTSVRS